ncbi:MAG: ImmA/IrrE family metallo-endopeptidase [Chloroflexota bacterium]
MWLEAGLGRLVDDFWGALPYDPPAFPRDLSRVASMALPVVTKELPHLSLKGVNRWLSERNMAESVSGPDRLLRGCMLAYGGYGIVLADSNDPADEKRFTVAHELAHFLIDYSEPRVRAIEALGDEIIPVLDGLRAATRVERLHAILSTVPLGLHVELMERTTAGGYTAKATLDAEDRADRLALELLAPADDALDAMSDLIESSGLSHGSRRVRATRLLASRYGLPEAQARDYARLLLKDVERGSSFQDWIGIVK